MEESETSDELITNQQEGVCPNCRGVGHLQYDYDEYYLDGDYLVFPFVCEECGFKGEELNSFVFEQNRGIACSGKDDEGRQKGKGKLNLNHRNMQRQAGGSNISFKPASSYLGFIGAGRALSMRHYRQKSKQQAPSKYVREYQPRSIVISYKPITKLVKLNQSFLRAAKKGIYSSSKGKVAKVYEKKSSKLYKIRNTQGWFKSLDAYLNN